MSAFVDLEKRRQCLNGVDWFHWRISVPSSRQKLSVRYSMEFLDRTFDRSSRLVIARELTRDAL